MRGSKAQTWSFDAIVAAVIFISAVSAFIIIISPNIDTRDVENLKDEAELIPQILLSSNVTELSIVDGARIDREKLTEIQTMDYENLKAELGIKSDFCIFFEDIDGNIINLSDFTGIDKGIGIGSSDINLTGSVLCSNS